MPILSKRDDFMAAVKTALAKRASYFCSNPGCRVTTLAPSKEDQSKSIYVGEASHITSAAPDGPRYNPLLTSEQRKDISNGIYLCKGCAKMIDVNNGIDHPEAMIRVWKAEHEAWVLNRLNNTTYPTITTVDGEHHGASEGEIIGLDIQTSAFINPGTKVSARGKGIIIATRIGGERRNE